MTKKTRFLIVLALLLAAWSLYLNRDRFGGKTIQISDRSFAPRGSMARYWADAPANPVVFLVNRDVRLSTLKVVVAEDAQTNKYPHALWELAADSRSEPTHEFIYGFNIRGMKPPVKGRIAEPLQPGVKYRLLLAIGSFKTQLDFTAVPKTK